METGLALAGGSVPKFASIGVIQALEEADINITHIGGTSAGAIVAALYAYGLSIQEIKETVTAMSRHHMDVNWIGVFRRFCFIRRNLDGCVKGERLEGLVRSITGDDDLSSFKIPCGLITSDLRMGKPVVLTNTDISSDKFMTEYDMSIAKALRACASIPIMYKPVKHKEYVLVDGGLVANCPVHLVKKLGAKKVISVDPLSEFKEDESYDDMSTILNRSITLTLEKQMNEAHQSADLNLYPEVGDVGLFEFDKIKQCIELGYNYTKNRIDEIKSVLAL
jgi:NTE family protein